MKTDSNYPGNATGQASSAQILTLPTAPGRHATTAGLLPVEFTVYKSTSGPLSKSFAIVGDRLEKQAAAEMTHGNARRVRCDFSVFGEHLLSADQGTAFGYGLPEYDTAHVVVERDPKAGQTIVIGETTRHYIARTRQFLTFASRPGVWMLDHDPHPNGVAVESPTALLGILEAIAPPVAESAAVWRGSLSARVVRVGADPEPSEGKRIYMAVLDASDIPRAGGVLFKRLWLAGYGFIAMSRSGSFLVRSIIDSVVFQPERLDFVGRPIIVGDGLEYRPEEPGYREGGYLDTRAALPDLSDEEKAEYDRLVSEAKDAIRPQAEAIRHTFSDEKVREMVARGVPEERARATMAATVARLDSGAACDLFGDFMLEFDHLGTATVGEVLANPARFDKETLADPIEGVSYGRNKAKFYANDGNGKPCIHSFAHGEARYFLHQHPPVSLAATGEDDGADDEGIEGASLPDKDAIKAATASARRAALGGEPAAKIARRIAKQWPTLKGQAEGIAANALAWTASKAEGGILPVNSVPRRIATMDSLNARFAALEAPGKPSCIIHRPDALPLSDKDFRARVATEVVITGVNDKGQPVTMDASRFWPNNAHRHTYRRIAFTSQPVADDTYNLFTGYGCNSVEGDCGLILAHIKEVICAGDSAAYEAMLSLLAWQFQNVGTPSRIIVVLFSEEQQTGKGTLLEHVLVPMAGLGGFMSSNPEHGFSRFNESLRGKFVVFMDEACFAGDRRLADHLKSVAAAKSIPIEGKGVPIIDMPNGMNLFLASNHAHAANVERTDARYWILKVSAHRKGDHAYFADLHRQIEHGGREAFLYFLLNRNVSDFIPQRDIPRENDMLAFNRAMSLPQGHPAIWLEECAEYGRFGGGTNAVIEWTAGATVKPADLHEAYRAWVRGLKGHSIAETPMNDLWDFLTSVGFLTRRSNGVRWRVLPALDECRRGIAAFLSGSKPDTKPAPPWARVTVGQ